MLGKPTCVFYITVNLIGSFVQMNRHISTEPTPLLFPYYCVDSVLDFKLILNNTHV